MKYEFVNPNTFLVILFVFSIYEYKIIYSRKNILLLRWKTLIEFYIIGLN